MRGKPGLVILIINDQFDYGDIRNSALQDFDKMQTIFSDLGFEIRAMRNYTKLQLKQELENGLYCMYILQSYIRVISGLCRLDLTHKDQYTMRLLAVE